MHLKGKVALVTGADASIGQAVASAFAREGADVCITYLSDEAGAQETKRQVEAAGRRVVVVRCDVMEAGSVQAAFDRTIMKLAHLIHRLGGSDCCWALGAAVQGACFITK